MNNKVCCLDVGFCNMGVAVWSPVRQSFIHSEVIKTSPTPKKERGYACIENTRRCRELVKGLRRLFVNYEFAAVIAELPHGGAQNQKAAVGMAIATAVSYCVFYLKGVPFYTVLPSEIKAVVSDDPQTPKSVVIAHARKLFGSAFIPRNAGMAEHIADAMLCIEVARRRLPGLV